MRIPVRRFNINLNLRVFRVPLRIQGHIEIIDAAIDPRPESAIRPAPRPLRLR